MSLPTPDRMKISDSPKRPTSKLKFCIVDSVKCGPYSRATAATGVGRIPRGSIGGQCRAHARRQHAFGEQVMASPVVTVEFIEAHRAALVRRVHETTMADVDRDVVDAMMATEKQQVAGLQGLPGNFRRIQRGDRARGARKFHARLGAEDVANQAAAVEARLRR